MIKLLLMMVLIPAIRRGGASTVLNNGVVFISRVKIFMFYAGIKGETCSREKR